MKTIAIVLKGYPRLSETFIAQELLGLERAGFALRLFSMRHPTDKHTHPVHDEISAPVSYLPEYLHDEPVRVLKGWRKARKLPGYAKARQRFIRDLKRDFTRNRVRRFGQALVMAAELPDDVQHLHAHFIHTPASVTSYVSDLTGLNWTCSAHAKDIWTSDDADLAGKLETARWVVTCTSNGQRHLASLGPAPEKVFLSYHGLDLQRFSSPGARSFDADGSNAEKPVTLVTVCRAVEKKGLDVLMQALATLPKSIHWKWVHIGAGGLVEDLKIQAKGLDLTERLEWRGPRPQTDVLDLYRKADIFVLPCRIAEDGDRDGLPNVIVEAQSQGLPVVSTNVSGVPELVDDGRNGLLVDAENADALAKALTTVITDPKRRAAMGKAGEKRVREHFDHIKSIKDLSDLFKSVGVLPGRKKT